MILFDKNTCIDIFPKNTNRYVILAIEDMRCDFERVSISGHKPKIVDFETEHCIIIEENTRESVEPFNDESFTLKSENGKITISADGYLGTMWGIYTFCEKFLGIGDL